MYLAKKKKKKKPKRCTFFIFHYMQYIVFYTCYNPNLHIYSAVLFSDVETKIPIIKNYHILTTSLISINLLSMLSNFTLDWIYGIDYLSYITFYFILISFYISFEFCNKKRYHYRANNIAVKFTVFKHLLPMFFPLHYNSNKW